MEAADARDGSGPGPGSTREMHNVSFVLNDCTAGTGPSLFPLQSVVSREMWK